MNKDASGPAFPVLQDIRYHNEFEYEPDMLGGDEGADS